MNHYVYKHRWLLIGIILTKVISACLHVFANLFIKKVVDLAIQGNSQEFAKLVIVITLYSVITCLHDYSSNLLVLFYLKKTITDLKLDIFKGIISRSYKEFFAKSTAAYISNLTNDANMIEVHYIITYIDIFGDISLCIVTFITLLYINLLITICLSVLSVVFIVIPIIFGKIISQKQENVMKNYESFTEKLKDIFLGYEVIKAYNIINMTLREFAVTTNDLEQSKLEANKCQTVIQVFSSFLTKITQTTAIVICGYLIIKKVISVGTLVAVVQLSSGLFAPVVAVIHKITVIKGMEKVNEETEKIIKVDACNKDKKSIIEFKNQIIFNCVDFSYDNKGAVLKNINLVFRKGKKYSIVGKSGSGKTTLIKLLSGFYNSNSGSIMVDNNNILDIEENCLRNMISIIHQDIFIFNKTIEENILLGTQVEEGFFVQVLKDSGVDEILDDIPERLNFRVGESGRYLSGGQKQRIAIARALAHSANLLVLDEWVSALDTKNAYNIESKILEIKDITLVSVTHRLTKSILDKYDEIIVLDKGSVVECGKFEDLINAKGLFYDLYMVTNNDHEYKSLDSISI